ncbi:HET-domain-containing protein, partial [Lojkania enalia]
MLIFDAVEAINHGVKPSGKVSSVSDPRIPTLLKALFFYNPLKEHQEIRLIDIFPANDLDSPIHCSVLHVNLLRPCHYEALSYVWGDPQIGDEIDIDGQRFPITKNLGKALRQIRRPTAKTRLWADAICINQEDPKERSCQVSLMSRIYRSASRVTVFL